jgi:diguanylate cyclase (GGDEF)-like protein
MSPLALLKRNWPWAGLALLCALIAFAAAVAPSKIGRMELEREALAATDRIGARLNSEPSALIDAFAKPALAPHISHIFDELGYGHRVLRYELYDDAGNLTFTSGRAGLQLDHDLADAADTAAAAEPKVSLHNRSGSEVSHFAVLTLPVRLSGKPDGTLLIYLDQSDQADVLSRYFGLVAAVTLLLLGAGVATPVALAWMRSRERREAEAQVRYLENYDPLTGLPNRKAFDERLTAAMASMNSARTSIAVLCLDVDKFQEINDTVDLAGGDEVLREIGARIQSTLRKGDFVARRASDEFAIALVDITNLGDVMSFMNRLVEALRYPFRVADREFVCTTSVGIALAPADGDTAPAILRHADIALARAKSDGGQRMCFFEQSMDKALQRRRMVEHELRLALSREEFEVVYQSQYDLATGTQVGVEALVRWNHPVHGKIAPAHFISVAEETGLIVPLGEWVLRRACRDATAWTEPLSVAVNLSPAQFRDGDVAEIVADVLQETGLPAHRLELEITESLLINDTEEVLGKLNRLRQLGVKIAMDDFGTGYSSLSYLARFPFDKIKIDRQFVRNMPRDPAMRAIVKTVIALGKSLDVTVTAEGVETQEQAAMLREFGCPQVQGFLYGYPGTPEAASQPPLKLKQIKARSSAA